MEQNSTTTEAADTLLFSGEAWFDPIETSIRGRVRGFIEELLEQELTAALGRSRSERVTGESRVTGMERARVSCGGGRPPGNGAERILPRRILLPLRPVSHHP